MAENQNYLKTKIYFSCTTILFNSQFISNFFIWSRVQGCHGVAKAPNDH